MFFSSRSFPLYNFFQPSSAILSPARKMIFLLLFSVLGALVGVFVLFPINEFVYFHEHGASASSAGVFVGEQLSEVLRGLKPLKTLFYAFIGAALGLFSASLFLAMLRRFWRQERLLEELAKNTVDLIARGEGPDVEFKSSFRWDLKVSSVNRAIETACLKSVAGFLNGRGGTLLVGVGDDGAVLGLEKDFQTLRRPNRDGFDQVFMTAISTRLGADVGPYVQILFHSVEGQDVARVLISPSPRPVFLVDGSTPKLYLRSGAATRELNVEEALAYRANRW